MFKSAFKVAFAVALGCLIVTNVHAAQSDATQSHDVAPQKAAPIDGFTGPRITLGARAGLTSFEGSVSRSPQAGLLLTDRMTATGHVAQVDVAFHFAPSWSFFGAYEYGSFDQTSTSSFPALKTHAVGGGFRLTTNRRSHLGFIAELGAGYRAVMFSHPTGTAVGDAIEPFRLALGITAIVTQGLRINLLASLSAAQLTRLDYGTEGCANTDLAQCDSVARDAKAWGIYRSISLGGTFDL